MVMFSLPFQRLHCSGTWYQQRQTHKKNHFNKDCIERGVQSTNVVIQCEHIELHKLAKCVCATWFIAFENLNVLRTQGGGIHWKKVANVQ